MKKITLLLSIFLLLSCGASKTADSAVAAADYGYTEESLILVGGENVSQGPIYERDYLGSLTGPDGEEITFRRIGSCCSFETENGFLGGGMLDKYEVMYKGLEKPVILYLNMYDPNPNPPLAPRGFTLKK